MKSLFKLTSKERAYQYASGLRFGALFSAVIAFAWSGALSQFISGMNSVLVVATLSLLSLILVASCFFVFKNTHFPQKVKLPYLRSWKFWAYFYGVILVEVAILYVVIRYLDAHQLSQAMWPLIVVVVGLHWIPLGWLNGIYLWYYTAGFLVVGTLAIITLVGRQGTVRLLGLSGNEWSLLSIVLMVIATFATSVLCLWLLSRIGKRTH